MSRVFSGHQPNFIPYMGFFYKIFQSDVFVLDDDVQYSRSGLHNANFLNVNQTRHKVTVPVSYRYGNKINEVEISYETDWISKLLKTIQMSYGKTPCFEVGYDLIERNLSSKHKYLFDLNYSLIAEMARGFELNAQIVIASKSVPTSLKKNQRNIYQCKKLGGNIYYSGTGGLAYNDEEEYKKNEIKIVYSDYSPVRYKQRGKGFIENLSALDYIFYRGYTIPEEWKRGDKCE